MYSALFARAPSIIWPALHRTLRDALNHPFSSAHLSSNVQLHFVSEIISFQFDRVLIESKAAFWIQTDYNPRISRRSLSDHWSAIRILSCAVHSTLVAVAVHLLEFHLSSASDRGVVHLLLTPVRSSQDLDSSERHLQPNVCCFDRAPRSYRAPRQQVLSSALG